METFITPKIMEEAATYLAENLSQKLNQNKKILLLLSGGSAVEVYWILVKWFKKESSSFAKNLTVGLVDERYGRPGHKDSNEKQIKDTGFYAVVKEKGGKTLSILTDRAGPCQSVTDRYNEFIHQHVEEADEVWAVLGIGPDGHTAGILPQESLEKFNQIFPDDKWVIYYELPENYPNPFRRRITLTPHALEKINLVVVVAKSQGKEEAIQRMFSSNEPVYKTPAVLLAKFNGVLFTDKRIFR